MGDIFSIILETIIWGPIEKFKEGSKAAYICFIIFIIAFCLEGIWLFVNIFI